MFLFSFWHVNQNVTEISPDSSGATSSVTHAVNRTQQEFNATLVCRSEADDLKSRVVATVHTFLETCVEGPDRLISESWNLCTNTGTFDCNDLRNYTSHCRLATQSPRCSSPIPHPPPPKCGIEQMVDQTEGLMLLIGVLLLGILIGVAMAVAVCLICPKIHSWMHSKLKTKFEITTEMGYDTDYTDIDDRMVGAPPQYQPNDISLYNVSNISSNSSEYTCSDYDTTNMLRSSRHVQRNNGITSVQGIYLRQSGLQCDSGNVSYSTGEANENDNHVLGKT